MKRLVFLMVSLLCASQAWAAKLPYSYYRAGSANDAVSVQLQGGVVLMVGSTDVDAVFQWLCGRAAGGDILVIRTTGTDAYNPDNQSSYVNYWKGTGVQTAVNSRIAAGSPVGGTSAGHNGLTQFIYPAQANKGVTSSRAHGLHAQDPAHLS